MPALSEQKMVELARQIDAFCTLDLTGLGVIPNLYRSLQKYQSGPMCLEAASILSRALPKPGGLALIVTGFPMGGGVPETDGPGGAALLARALVMGLGARVVVVTDAGWEAPVEGALIGAGLKPLPLEPGRAPQEVPYLRAAYVQPVERDSRACHAMCDGFLEHWSPDVVVSIERPGQNRLGTYHGMNGRSITGQVADLDYLLDQCEQKGVPTVAIGDGGNELGMGLLKDDLPLYLPQCSPDLDYGGTAACQKAGHLLVSVVSNWGASCLVAALGLLLGRPDVWHEPEREARVLELCAAAGAVDGGTLAPDAYADGVPAAEWVGLWRMLRGALSRGMGLGFDWRRG